MASKSAIQLNTYTVSNQSQRYCVSACWLDNNVHILKLEQATLFTVLLYEGLIM